MLFLFVRFALVWFCLFPLPLGVWEGLQLVIVALPGLFSYLFCLLGEKDQTFISSIICNKLVCQMFALLGPFLTKGHKLNKLIHSFV